MVIMEYIFWLIFLIIMYVYIGYPFILRMTKFAGKSITKKQITPHVTLFIPAYNEGKVIKDKIENSLALDYPIDKFEIVVASDGSKDDTVNIIKNYLGKGVILHEAGRRGGKNSIINEFIPRCNGEIIVFTDANAFFNADAINKLVRNFNDETVGCVAGNLRYVNEKMPVGKGEGLYFRYESMIRKLESVHGTVVAASGAIYAIRKKLFVSLDVDVPNDFIHPIQIGYKGYKIVFEPEAVACEQATSSTMEEFKRKTRIVTRSITAFMRYRRSYSMLKGTWGFCFISHKLLRWCIPFFLIALFFINLFLHSPLFKFTMYSQLVFYFIAFIGAFFKSRLGKIFAVPFYFCIINLAALMGILKYLGGKRQSIWEVAKTTR